MSNKDIAKEIFANVIDSVHPKNFISKYCSLDKEAIYICGNKHKFKDFKNLYVFGSGKAAYSMAKEIENILGDKIYKGLVVSPYDDNELKKIEVKVGSHPIPTQKTLDASNELLKMMRKCEEDDLYIYLLSGGSSSLLELPIVPIELDDLKIATYLMLSNNLEIHQINTVRKHISKVKGGRLALECKAKGEVLVVSDIIDNDLYSIGSAPLYADKSTFIEAIDILKAKDIFEKMPLNVQMVLKLGLNEHIQESPTEHLDRVTHHVVVSNPHAKEFAKEMVTTLGMSVKVVNEPMDVEVTTMVQKLLKSIDDFDEKCIIFGGECTVSLSGDGEGGRNQHLALLMLKEIIKNDLDISFLSAGTDGIDGNSDAAGGVVDKQSAKKAKELNLDIDDYLKRFDSYNLLKQTNDLIITGPSGTNVIDIVIIIKGDKDG